MKVKCISVDDGLVGFSAAKHLVIGRVYEVIRAVGTKSNHGTFQLIGVDWAWSMHGFEVVSDDACPQCGNFHQEVK